MDAKDTSLKYQEQFDSSIEKTLLDEIAEYALRKDVSLVGFHLRKIEYYKELKSRTSFLPSNANIKERFWHLYHETSIKPTCERDGCHDQVRWHRINRNHNRFCSVSCAKYVDWQVSEKLLKKVKKT